MKPLIVGACLLAPALGWIVPAYAQECRLNVNESRMDFGLMNRAILEPQASEQSLGERHLSLNLNCPEPADMSLAYKALAAGHEYFRFTDKGRYDIHVSEGVLDGQAVDLGLLAGRGQAPSARASALGWRPDHVIVPLKDGAPAVGSAFSVQLKIRAWAKVEATRVRDAVTWEVAGLFDTADGNARELTLQARFAPAACVPSLSNGGVVDFGRLWAKNLNADQDSALPSRTLILSIGCDAPTHFALRMQDNRKGSATGGIDETAYGLGQDNSQNNIGRYFLYFDPFDFSADTLPRLYRTDSTTNGVAWSSASASPIPIGNNSFLGFTDTQGSQAGPTALQNLSGEVSIRALLAPMNNLDLSNEVLLDGSGTLEIVYL
ncbi:MULTISPECIES: DUF1120 domain-containing protein [unclassified Pseudomonas]|uniref:DUF1120 domain-containing protein n=1 Tax=unclassified Pseudomonas TaxID=196821 RepID=UPI002AC9C17A|nr:MULTISPECIES: DUF1120 domain-containing protein [unclassified Pseudomonas]MEB0044367.1 DUF1120 domain-containing protein [Pseudomonas sp. Dout3]MEB0094696.1 DUF1120 domain-containing protein [Pseudomonas sp. DC1.2]WPX59937.1 DUF1120 domain-containing protein [Pseudomonas sp. DC1.2]